MVFARGVEGAWTMIIPLFEEQAKRSNHPEDKTE